MVKVIVSYILKILGPGFFLLLCMCVIDKLFFSPHWPQQQDEYLVEQKWCFQCRATA